MRFFDGLEMFFGKMNVVVVLLCIYMFIRIDMYSFCLRIDM